MVGEVSAAGHTGGAGRTVGLTAVCCALLTSLLSLLPGTAASGATHQAPPTAKQPAHLRQNPAPAALPRDTRQPDPTPAISGTPDPAPSSPSPGPQTTSPATPAPPHGPPSPQPSTPATTPSSAATPQPSSPPATSN